MSFKAKNNVADADDVLDFINSLPESKNNEQRTNGKGDKELTRKSENDEELFDFLDELAAQEPAKDQTSDTSKQESVDLKTTSKVNDSGDAGPDDKNVKSAKENEEKKEPEKRREDADNEQGGIGNLLSWWNEDNSKKVSSLWGTIASSAQNIGEQTYQLASNTSNQLSQQRHKLAGEVDHDQIQKISSKLNLILSTMSQQINQGLMGEADELLNVLLVNDFYKLDYLEEECLDKFSWVKKQVEGGIQVTVDSFNHKGMHEEPKIDLNIFYGKLIDGEKLCLANLESAIKNYEQILGKEDQQEEKKPENGTEGEEIGQDEIKQSNIFISIQAISTSTGTESSDEPEKSSGDVVSIDALNKESFVFALVLKDSSNNITISTKSQAFPLQWARWLEGEKSDLKEFSEVLPSEWVKGWVREGLSVSLGVLAQQYVVTRMGYY